MKTSRSKTFQQGCDYQEIIDWFVKHIDTEDFQPEGTNWSGGEIGPWDPECNLKHKYIVTITKVDVTEK